jgi:LacI family transcriptional regulator
MSTVSDALGTMPTPPIQNLAAIAAEAGVSRMTVSRALRNARGVDPATRERILAAVEKVGWRPNPMVSAFMSYVRTKRAPNEAGVLAYLTDEVTRDGRRSLDFYRRFYNGAVERANSRGYRLEVFKLRERGMTDRRLSDVLYARGIRGIVVSPMSSSHAHLNLDWGKFSAAAIGYSLLKPVLSRSTNDQYGTMLLALRELRRLGYGRIALALPQPNDARVYYHWTAGFYSHHWRYYPEDQAAAALPASLARRRGHGLVAQDQARGPRHHLVATSFPASSTRASTFPARWALSASTGRGSCARLRRRPDR